MYLGSFVVRRTREDQKGYIGRFLLWRCCSCKNVVSGVIVHMVCNPFRVGAEFLHKGGVTTQEFAELRTADIR